MVTWSLHAGYVNQMAAASGYAGVFIGMWGSSLVCKLLAMAIAFCLSVTCYNVQHSQSRVSSAVVQPHTHILVSQLAAWL